MYKTKFKTKFFIYKCFLIYRVISYVKLVLLPLTSNCEFLTIYPFIDFNLQSCLFFAFGKSKFIMYHTAIPLFPFPSLPPSRRSPETFSASELDSPIHEALYHPHISKLNPTPHIFRAAYRSKEDRRVDRIDLRSS